MRERTSVASRSPLILVVDDQNTNVQLLGQTLDQAGYQVMPALNGEQAITRASARRPDLVLLDMVMPGMDGAETCRRLHELPGCVDLPVIFVTGANDRGSLVTAFGAGAVDYITKPFVVEELLARVRTHLDLKLARDRLAVMLREREDVTNIVAHDLKNPLHSIRFAARLLRRRGDQPAEELLDDIENCAEEALQFIQRFLARGAEGQRLRQFSAERFDLAEVARSAAQLLRSHAAAQGIEIVVDGQASAYADPFMARNVIQGLLSNAIRHSPPDSQIRIELGDSRAGYSRCLVMDRGPGIPPEEEGKLFQRFVRLAAARENKSSDYSSGLGLAIAKHDVAQMGGHLWYEPRPGGGAIFAVELPQTREVDI